MVGTITKHCIRSVADNILNRNFQGYRIRIGTEWYELSLTACEPCDGPEIQDSEVI